MKNNELFWTRSEDSKADYILKSETEKIATLKFTNFSGSNAVIELNNNQLELTKTGFPNPTTIVITELEKEIAKLIVPPFKRAEGNIELSEGITLDWIYFDSVGELKIKKNGLNSPNVIHLKPKIIDYSKKIFSVELNNEDFTDSEIIAMVILGFYLLINEFKETLLLGVGIGEILLWFGLGALFS